MKISNYYVINGDVVSTIIGDINEQDVTILEVDNDLVPANYDDEQVCTDLGLYWFAGNLEKPVWLIGAKK